MSPPLYARLTAIVIRYESRPWVWWRPEQTPGHRRLLARYHEAMRAFPDKRTRRLGSSLRRLIEADHSRHDWVAAPGRACDAPDCPLCGPDACMADDIGTDCRCHACEMARVDAAEWAYNHERDRRILDGMEG
jgi:hypothetical protein